MSGCEYPPATDSDTDGQSRNNTAWYPDAQATASMGYSGYGTVWSRRLPFETIIDPYSTLLGQDLFDMEPDVSCSFAWPITASMTSAPTNELYSFMASNFMAEVGKFF